MSEGKYHNAGARAADGFVNLVDYQIPVIHDKFHMWPYFMLQGYGGTDKKQKAADTTSGFMIGLLDRHNYDNLTGCFTFEDFFNNDIDDVLNLLVSKTNENIAKAVNKMSRTANEMDF